MQKYFAEGEGKRGAKAIFPPEVTTEEEKYGKGSNVSKANTENKIT